MSDDRPPNVTPKYSTALDLFCYHHHLQQSLSLTRCEYTNPLWTIHTANNCSPTRSPLPLYKVCRINQCVIIVVVVSPIPIIPPRPGTPQLTLLLVPQLVQPDPFGLCEGLSLRLGHQLLVHPDHVGRGQLHRRIVRALVVAPHVLAHHIARLLALEGGGARHLDGLRDRVLLGTHGQVLLGMKYRGKSSYYLVHQNLRLVATAYRHVLGPVV